MHSNGGNGPSVGRLNYVGVGEYSSVSTRDVAGRVIAAQTRRRERAARYTSDYGY